MSFDPNQKRGGANPGNWAKYENSDPEAVLALGVSEGQTIVQRFEHDGGLVSIATFVSERDIQDETVTLDSYQVFDSVYMAEFDVPIGASEDHVSQAAVAAFDTARLRVATQRKGTFPALDAALDIQMAKLKRAIDKPEGLRAPEDWDYMIELHPASGRLTDTLTPEEAHAPVDYAIVGASGIDYGLKLPEGTFGRVLVGEQGVDEDDFTYKNRWQDEAWDQDAWPLIETFLESEYGVKLQEDTRSSVTVEIHVPYRPEDGIDESSIEEMGERAILSSTSLESLRDEFSDGDNELEQGLAKALGYEFDPSVPSDPDGTNEGGRYRKTAAAVLA